MCIALIPLWLVDIRATNIIGEVVDVIDSQAWRLLYHVFRTGKNARILIEIADFQLLSA